MSLEHLLRDMWMIFKLHSERMQYWLEGISWQYKSILQFNNCYILAVWRHTKGTTYLIDLMTHIHWQTWCQSSKVHNFCLSLKRCQTFLVITEVDCTQRFGHQLEQWGQLRIGYLSIALTMPLSLFQTNVTIPWFFSTLRQWEMEEALASSILERAYPF